jgi:hypothetical protein
MILLERWWLREIKKTDVTRSITVGVAQTTGIILRCRIKSFTLDIYYIFFISSEN